MGLLTIFGGLLINNNQVSAAKYGARSYTTPKKMRGTWHLKKTKTLYSQDVSKNILHPYSKITITKHTITFTRKSGKSALKGKYYLYKTPKKAISFSVKTMGKAETYATKHRWLAPYNVKSNGFSFSNYWLHVFESSSCGDLTVKGKTLTFANLYMRDSFRK